VKSAGVWKKQIAEGGGFFFPLVLVRCTLAREFEYLTQENRNRSGDGCNRVEMLADTEFAEDAGPIDAREGQRGEQIWRRVGATL
jgi:hypothetical protein